MEMSIAEALQALLAKTPLTDLCSSEQNVVTLEHSVSIAEAMQLLAKNRILSAPLVASCDLEDVAESKGAVDMTPRLLGWVDVNDMLLGFLRCIKERHDPVPTKMLQLMTVLESEGPEFSKRMVVTLSGGHDRGLMYQADSNSSLLHVIRNVFLQPTQEGGTRVVHRLAVFDAHGEVVRVVSQTDIIRFIRSKLGLLPEGLATSSVEALGMLAGKLPVVAVSPHEPALLAFDRILGACVSGAAVVADSGELIANVSLSDLRCIQPEHFGALALPVGEFLALLHGTVYVGYGVQSSAASHPFFAKEGASKAGARAVPADNPTEIRLITCLASTTFEELLDKFVEHHVHRVYVVDKTDKPRPLAVISLTDVLRLVAGVF